jgi:hypothetical protein
VLQYRREKTLNEMSFEVKLIQLRLYILACIFYFEKTSDELLPPNPKELVST